MYIHTRLIYTDKSMTFEENIPLNITCVSTTKILPKSSQDILYDINSSTTLQDNNKDDTLAKYNSEDEINAIKNIKIDNCSENDIKIYDCCDNHDKPPCLQMEEVTHLSDPNKRVNVVYTYNSTITLEPNEFYKEDEVNALHWFHEILVKSKIYSSVLMLVNDNYYNTELLCRVKQLRSHSVDNFFKSILVENTRCKHYETHPSDITKSRYFLIVLPYDGKFNAKTVANVIRSKHNNALSSKAFNIRMVTTDICYQLSGYVRNSVTPIGLKVSVPIIASSFIKTIQPPYMWLGGGHVNIKLRIDVDEFTRCCSPYYANID